MSDTEEQVEETNNEEQPAVKQTHEIWNLIRSNQVGKIAAEIKKKPASILKERDYENGEMTIAQWAVLKGHHMLVEQILTKGKSHAFSVRNESLFKVHKSWMSERKRQKAEEEEKQKRLAEEGAEDEADAEDEEEGEEKPDFAETLAQETGISVYKIREIGALGYYDGDVNELGEREGLGTAFYPNGDIYIGQFKVNQKNGKGIYKYVDGGLYVGDFENNAKQGTGRMLYPDKSKYYGRWNGNQRHGHGLYTYPNGDAYSGQWSKDKKHGNGTYTSNADKSMLIGTWKDGAFEGREWKLDNGTVFKGDFRDGRPAGTGVLRFPQTGIATHGEFDCNGGWKHGVIKNAFSKIVV